MIKALWYRDPVQVTLCFAVGYVKLSSFDVCNDIFQLETLPTNLGDEPEILMKK
jgi:hypothetical protein